ncbi:MAG: hypothetical protein IIA67_14630, partial [Planctomycetes bacterium]|nr:hypothetical protein [Planctomycetota bacterium]
MLKTIAGLGIATLLAAAWQQPVAADETPPAKTTYDEHVKPIFREHCFSCHNEEDKESDLSLAMFSSLITGGASEGVIEPGDP